jgi:uncharacterized protein RhaS with RHS repeats
MNYNYYRTYEPATGRYLQSDPIGLGGGANTYGYVSANPMQYDDLFGLKDGRYDSPDGAGVAAVFAINPKSIATDTEYAGVIYRNSDGSYDYTSPNKGYQDVSYPGSAPWFTEEVATYHTHSGDDPGFDNEHFSQGDKDEVDRLGQPGYLGTPSGSVKKYNPGGIYGYEETLVKGAVCP